MRSTLKFALLFLSLSTAFAGLAARADAYDDLGDTVLVSPEQGQALAEFALQSPRRIRPRPDCSHLVHLLYSRAGLIYPYQDSRVLYRGISDFERVKTPQPGDLAVWQGHVGIVLSPEEKTFLSSVRSGILTESWTAAHWVRRGRPRFYRYRIGPAANMDLLAAMMNDETRGPNKIHDNSPSSTTAQLPFSTGDLSAGKVEEDSSRAERDEALSEDSETGLNKHESGASSSSIVGVIPQRQTPSKRQIVAAIMESSNVRARRLSNDEILDFTHPLSIFEHLEVENIKVEHESGWITIRLSETICQEAGKILPGGTVERELSIRRNDGLWIISDPRSRMYLAQENAVDIFERQTEIFLSRAPNSSTTRAMVKALDRLYDQLPAQPQRAAIR